MTDSRLKPRWILKLTPLAAACAAVLAFPAFAQEDSDPDPNALPDEVVDSLERESDEMDDPVLEEVRVVGIRSSLRDALNIKRESDTFVDAIVAEDIGKLPDDNIAETLARVPGVLLEREAGEGVNVSIRGIRENRTEVNGRTLISAQGRGSNAGLFNYFPSAVAGSVEVTKLLTADMADGALGGTININTRRPLDYDGIWGGGNLEYNYTDLNGDDGYRGSALVSANLIDNTFGILLGVTHEDRPITQDIFYSNGDWRSDTSIPSGWTLPNPSDPTIYYMYDVRYQRKTETREKSSANAALQWKLADNFELNADVLYAQYDYDRSRGWLSATMAHPRQNRVSNPVISEHNHLLAGDVSNSTTTTDHEGYQQPQDFITGGINANWELDSGLRVFAEVAFTKTNSESYQQYLQMLKTGVDFSFDFRGAEIPTIDSSAVDLDPLNYTIRGMYDRKTVNEADENSIRLDFEYPLEGFFNQVSAGFRMSDISTLETYYAKRGVSTNPGSGAPVNWDTVEVTSMLRAGYGYFAPDYYDWAMAALRPFDLSGVLPGTGVNLPPEMIVLDTHLIGTGGFGFSDVFYDAPFEQFPERTSDVGDRVSAIYLRGDFEFSGWEGNIGLRYAKTDTEVDNYSLQDGQYVPFYKKGSYTDLLPSLVVKKMLTDELLLRVGVGQMIARPPTSVIGAVARVNLVIDDPETPIDESDSSSAILPNPDLKPQRSTNLDASLEWYFTDTSALALGLFYKDMDNQIDPAAKTSGTIDGFGDQVFLITQAENISGGWIAGAEIAYQQEFLFLPGFLSRTGASINYTWLDSETDELDPRTGAKLPIRGMSKSSLNAQIYYEDESLSARLLYNWRDNYFDHLDPYSQNTPIWNEGQPSLDMSVQYRFTDAVRLEFKAINLLDSPRQEFAGFEQYVNSYSMTGIRYGVGLRVRFQ